MPAAHRNYGQRVSYVEADPNGFTWDFQGVTGLAFEAEIQRFVRHSLRPDGENIWVVDTPRTGDRGKDIVVHFKSNISVLGVTFSVPRDVEIASLYIECKKTDDHTLSPGDFGGSLLQLNAEGRTPQYFLLVTNAALSPELHHNARERFRHNGCSFHLVDRRRLAIALHGWSSVFLFPDGMAGSATVSASYSAFDRDTMRCLLSSPTDSEGERGNRKVIEAFVALDNYTAETKNARLSLRSDINWLISLRSDSGGEQSEFLNFFIPPFETRTAKLRLEQRSLDALDELRLGLSIDGRSRTLEIRGRKLEFDFDPPLFGAGHLNLVDQIHNAVCCATQVAFISLQGDAGTGKSKILEELADRLRGSDRHLSRVELRPGREAADLGLVLKELSHVNGLLTPSPEPSTAEFFQSLERVADHYQHYVICLEDLHHASEGLLAGLREFSGRKTGGNVTIIGTGRTDGTFPNDHYFALLDHTAITASAPDESRAGIMDLTIGRWSDEDCRRFIQLTVAEAPNLVVDRIHLLSENTPFGVIQAIEYLLDLDIARVVNRNTVGVTNAEEIGGKCEIPEELSVLIARRCDHLVSVSSNRARVLLIALSALGMQVEANIVRELVRAGADEDGLMAAERQKFIEVRNGRVRFLHENLQVFFLRLLENHADGAEGALRLLQTDAALITLQPFQIGSLHMVAGNPEAAFGQLHALWEESTSSANISSINIAAANLRYFRPLINAAVALNKAQADVARLCVIETYGALHNAPLAIALKTAQRQYDILGRLPLPAEEKEAFVLEIRQLEAHILLNMGHVLAAQKIMLEISVKATLSPPVAQNYRLMFDVFDRLQNIYHQLNHKQQFIHYSDLSRKAALELGDEKLLALVRSSRAKEFAFDDPDEFLRLTGEATSWARQYASCRHVCHAELNLCIAKIIAAPDDPSILSQEIIALSDLLSEASKNAYSFSITRAELALATAYALSGLDREENRRAAARYARIGIDSCLRFGTGFFIWQLHNLLAIVEMHERDANLERAAGHWQTALHYLERQGLLFLGSLDSCSPNLAVISNVIRFVYENENDEAVRTLIDRLHTYDGGRMESGARYRHLLKSVRDFGLIGRSSVLSTPLRVPTSGYMLALR
ncbi:MAG: ATP-binding protein [Pseudomonadota bacterium]